MTTKTPAPVEGGMQDGDQRTPDEIRLAWFAASDPPARAVERDALRDLAAGRAGWRPRTAAVRHLIELLHLADHVADRVALVRILGTVEHANAVPALHAELHHPETAVRLAALESLGQLGFPFGGAMVARWFRAQDVREEPTELTARALLTLAQTGHPSVEALAVSLWASGRIDPVTLHLALAEIASPALREAAIAHVPSPVAGVAAALHLAAMRADGLSDLLQPMLRSTDLMQVHFAERLLALQPTSAQDDLLELVGRRWRLGPLGRAARRLRVHPPEVLVVAFRELVGLAPEARRERQAFVRALLLIGVPLLQSAVLDWARGEGPLLAHALQWVCRDGPGLRPLLHALAASDDDDVATAALRARIAIEGTEIAPEELAALARSNRPVVRREAVRGLLSSYRDHRGADRRTRLTGQARGVAESLLRGALAAEDTETRRLATYAVGNLGLTALTDDVRRLLVPEADVQIRQAAATALVELPPSTPAAQLGDWIRAEPAADVRFRLGLALLDRLASGGSERMDLRSVARHLGDREDLQVLALRLLGHADDDDAVRMVCRGATDTRLSHAEAAISALSHPAGLPVLTGVLERGDPARRLRVVEALARFPSPEAGDLLVRAAGDDPDLEVRRAALEVLARRPAPGAGRLRPTGANDPLLFELIQARGAAEGGGVRDVAAVDDRLARALPGLRLDRLRRRCPDALRALRTAEYLSAAPELPEGLDAAPAALFWVKGLELWLHDWTAPLRVTLREPGPLRALEAARYVWPELQAHAAGWPKVDATPGWNTLLDGVLRSLGRRGDGVLSLRDVAACLLATGPLARRLGLPEWRREVPAAAIGALCHELMTLAHARNRLTHRSAGTASESDAVRARALRAAQTLVEVGG